MGYRVMLVCWMLALLLLPPHALAQPKERTPEELAADRLANEEHFWQGLDAHLEAGTDANLEWPQEHETLKEGATYAPRIRFTLDVLHEQTWLDWFGNTSPDGPALAHRIVSQWKERVGDLLPDKYQDMKEEAGPDFEIIVAGLDTLEEVLREQHPTLSFRSLVYRLSTPAYQDIHDEFLKLEGAGLLLSMMVLGQEHKNRLQPLMMLVSGTDFLRPWSRGGVGDWSMKRLFYSSAEPDKFLQKHRFMVGLGIANRLIPMPKVALAPSFLFVQGPDYCCGDRQRECNYIGDGYGCWLTPLNFCTTVSIPCPE